MMPSAVERKAGLGTSITAESETSTVRPGEEDGLAGGVHRRRRPRRRGSSFWPKMRAAEAHRRRRARSRCPSASANISAKFIAQIEIGETSVPRKSEPGGGDQADDRQHQRKPAATSEPKASTRIASVTGQEMSSDFSIASRLASLKSDHIPDGAGQVDLATPGAATPASLS